MKNTINKGINLTDIIPIHKPNTRLTKSKIEKLNEYMELKSGLINLEKSLNSYFHRDKTRNIIGSAMDLGSRLSMMELRLDFLKEFYYLPSEMQNSFEINERYNPTELLIEGEDYLTKLSKAPKLQGKDVKDIVNKFGFISIPLECLNENSYSKESYDLKTQIRSFGKNLENFNVYVITPMEYYSLENHIHKNTSEKGIYAGKNSSVFASVTISIPMFRSMLNTISDLKVGVDKLSAENNHIKASLTQMDSAIKQLQKDVDRQQSQIYKQEIALKVANAKFEEMVLKVIDPIMIAFDKDIDINSDEFDSSCCYVGPCWGPDFNENVSLALDLKIIKNQRSLLTKTSQQLWN